MAIKITNGPLKLKDVEFGMEIQHTNFVYNNVVDCCSFIYNGVRCCLSPAVLDLLFYHRVIAMWT
jgi:hypothetical protein